MPGRQSRREIDLLAGTRTSRDYEPEATGQPWTYQPAGRSNRSLLKDVDGRLRASRQIGGSFYLIEAAALHRVLFDGGQQSTGPGTGHASGELYQRACGSGGVHCATAGEMPSDVSLSVVR